jgi:prepilin-type N-terminal cleavage/methylation domain-containing protein/prepilin-type processing-associated H-X9-DG protein
MKSLARINFKFVCHKTGQKNYAHAQKGSRQPALSTLAPIANRAGMSGFTLLELLVVVAMMGILAAMLFSTFSRATAKTRSIYCKNNLREIGTAVEMYVGDNQSTFPNYSTLDGVLWETALQPYYPVAWSNQLTQCPSYTGLQPATVVERGQGGGMASSYGYNTWGVTWQPVNIPALNYCLGLGVDAVRVTEELGATYGASVKAVLDHRESQIVAPSELYAFMDSRGSPITIRSGNNSMQVWAGWDHTDGIPTSSEDYPYLQSTPQHDAHFNVLFCDSHVESVRVANLFEPVPAAQGIVPHWQGAHNWNIDDQPHLEGWLYGEGGKAAATAAVRERP